MKLARTISWRLLYSLLLLLLVPLALLYLLIELRRRGGGTRFLAQRLGFAYRQLTADSIVFHCASVGEVNTIKPLVAKLTQSLDLTIIITTNTPTAAAQVASIPKVEHAYLPLDYAYLVRRFLNAVKPRKIFIVETELWANLYRQAHNRNIPLYIINGRLSRKTLAKKSLYGLFALSLNKVTAVYARSHQDSAAFKSIAPNIKVEEMGNLKWNKAVFDANIQLETARQYIIAASTHHNEELQLALEWREQLPKSQFAGQNYLLVIAPRHAERGKVLAEQLKNSGFTVARRSQKQPINAKTEVYLADTTGELAALMAGAEIVFVGGSLIAHGGQNIIEPASLGKRIVCGMHMQNFSAEIDRLNALGIALQVPSAKQAVASLLADAKRPLPRRAVQELEQIFANCQRAIDYYCALISNNST